LIGRDEHAYFVDVAKAWLLDGVVPPSDQHHLQIALERLVESMLGLLFSRATRSGKVIVGKGTKSLIGRAGQIAAPLGSAAGPPAFLCSDGSKTERVFQSEMPNICPTSNDTSTEAAARANPFSCTRRRI
jgi:hypothetical protein